MAAFAANLFLYCGSLLEYGIVKRAAFTIAAEAGIVAYAEAVEIGFCRLALKTAVVLESADGDVSIVDAAAKCFIHGLGVVHLAIAYTSLPFSEAVAATVSILDELLAGNEFDASIHDVAPRHLLWVGMLAQKPQFGSQRAEGRFHAIAFAKPHRSNLAEQVEKQFNLALAGVAILGTEVVNGIKVVFVLYDGLGIEQGFAVVALRGARVQFKEYSVSLTWHSCSVTFDEPPCAPAQGGFLLVCRGATTPGQYR